MTTENEPRKRHRWRDTDPLGAGPGGAHCWQCVQCGLFKMTSGR
jgi:hypothetical protein